MDYKSDRYICWTGIHWSVAGQINGYTSVNLHFVSGRTVWDWGILELGDPLNRSYTFHATHWSLRKVLQVLSYNYRFVWQKERYTNTCIYTCPAHQNFTFAVSTVCKELELCPHKDVNRWAVTDRGSYSSSSDQWDLCVGTNISMGLYINTAQQLLYAQSHYAIDQPSIHWQYISVCVPTQLIMLQKTTHMYMYLAEHALWRLHCAMKLKVPN